MFVINIHTIKPIDRDIITKAARNGKIITVEEHSIGGLGSGCGSCNETVLYLLLKSGVNDVFGHSVILYFIEKIWIIRRKYRCNSKELQA